MAIYESTSSSSSSPPASAPSTVVLHRLLSLLQLRSDRSRGGDAIMNRMRPLSSSSSSPSGSSLASSALGWTVSVGVSLLVLQYLGKHHPHFQSTTRRRTTAKSLLPTDDEDEADDSHDVDNEKEDEDLPALPVGALLYQFFQQQLTRLRDLIVESSPHGLLRHEDYDTDEDTDRGSLVVHEGTCHCGSIAFQVSAPLVLHVEEESSSGKLSYPSVRVPESSFQLLRGKDVWQTYYVPDEQTGATQAFSFCRNCAVHLVHAVDSDPFVVSFNVHCLTTPWKKAKSRSQARISAFQRRNRSKKRPSPARLSSLRAQPTTTVQGPRTPEMRSSSPPPSSLRSPSPISFDSKLTDSPTPPQGGEDDKPVKEVVRLAGPASLFSNHKEDSLSVDTSSKFSSADNSRHGETWGAEAEHDNHNNHMGEGGDQGPFALHRKPAPRFHAASSLDWPTDTTDTSTYLLYGDDESSLYDSSVRSAPGPSTPGGGLPRGPAASISSNYALREKLRSHMSKHMKPGSSS